MRDLDKDIEQKLKDQFNQQDFEIQDAWLTDMSTKLDEHNKKNRKFIFFWLFGGALVLATGLFAWSNNYSELKDENLYVSTEEKLINETKPEMNTSKIVDNNKYTFTYTELPCQPHEINQAESDLTENNIQKNIKQKNNKDAINSKKRTKNLSNKISISKDKKPSVNSNKNFSSTQVVKSVNTQLNNANYTKNDYFSQKENESVTTFSSNKKSEKPSNSIQTNVVSDLNIKSSKIQYTDETDPTEKGNNADLKGSIEESNLALLKDTITEEIDSLQKEGENSFLKEESTKKKKELGLSLSVNAGASFLFRNFNSESENIKRVEEESNKTTWNLNVELYKTFANNLILGTGVNITNYGEKIDYSSVLENYKDTTFKPEVFNYFNVSLNSTAQAFTRDTTAILYHDTTMVIVDSAYNNTEVQQANGRTNFTYVEIPLHIGYRILNTKKWKLRATTGVSLGFLINSQGNYVAQANELKPAENEKVIFNYLLSAQLDYNIYKNLNLSLVPHFKYSLNNNSVYPSTTKRYGTFGVNAGISLDF